MKLQKLNAVACETREILILEYFEYIRSASLNVKTKHLHLKPKHSLQKYVSLFQYDIIFYCNSFSHCVLIILFIYLCCYTTLNYHYFGSFTLIAALSIPQLLAIPHFKVRIQLFPLNHFTLQNNLNLLFPYKVT